MFRNIVLSALAVAALGVSYPAMAADAPAKNLTKADVEAIIKDYIMENPQLILTTVYDYQEKTIRDRQAEGFARNKDLLMNDTSAPILGNPDGDVTVVEFIDYNCHYCKIAFPELETLMGKDKKVRVIMKDFPILGPSSEAAAKWALAAHNQKKYFEFHKALMANKTPINDGLLEKIAKEVGMNIDEAKKDASSSATTLQIEKNRSLAQQLGLSGTPAFIVGDEIIPRGMKADELQKKTEEQRQKKK